MLVSPDCAISITTLPALARLRPDAAVLWLDAHADFAEPDGSSTSRLRGMSLAAACGRWDAGFPGPPIDPARIVMCGVRDVGVGERVALERAGVGLVERPSQLAALLGDATLYVHLDLDVLDPRVMPDLPQPADDGFSDGGLRTLLAEVANAADVVGLQLTGLPGSALAQRVATIVEPLLPS